MQSPTKNLKKNGKTNFLEVNTPMKMSLSRVIIYLFISGQEFISNIAQFVFRDIEINGK